MPQESGIKTWQWIVTAIVIIILIVIGVMVFGKKSSDGEPSGATTPTTAPSAVTGANTIVMSDQYPGNVVYISSVTVANSSWIAIHKDSNGQPGDLIGTAWVDAGTSPVRITTTAPIVDGAAYYAMLHSDDGDKKFDPAKDLPLKDSNGNAIMRMFRGSATADQNTKG